MTAVFYQIEENTKYYVRYRKLNLDTLGEVGDDFVTADELEAIIKRKPLGAADDIDFTYSHYDVKKAAVKAYVAELKKQILAKGKKSGKMSDEFAECMRVSYYNAGDDIRFSGDRMILVDHDKNMRKKAALAFIRAGLRIYGRLNNIDLNISMINSNDHNAILVVKKLLTLDELKANMAFDGLADDDEVALFEDIWNSPEKYAKPPKKDVDQN